MALTENTLKVPALIFNDEKNIEYTKTIVKHKHTHKVEPKHQWQGKKTSKDVATRSSMLANWAAATNLKILHKAGQMLSTQEIVEACWLNWIDLDFQGVIIWIFINATLQWYFGLWSSLSIWINTPFYYSRVDKIFKQEEWGPVSTSWPSLFQLPSFYYDISLDKNKKVRRCDITAGSKAVSILAIHMNYFKISSLEDLPYTWPWHWL